MTQPALLVVEDAPDDARFIVTAAQKVVAAELIQVCSDGNEAFDYLHCRGAYATRNPVEQPRLVLLDLGLPGRSGVHVLGELRTDPRTRLIPVVVVSSSANAQDVSRAFALGANSFVRKSDDFAGMSAQIEQIVRYWLELNLAPPATLAATTA